MLAFGLTWKTSKIALGNSNDFEFRCAFQFLINFFQYVVGMRKQIKMETCSEFLLLHSFLILD